MPKVQLLDHLWHISYVASFFFCSIIPPPNPLMVPSSMTTIEGFLLPYILVWNPLLLFPTFFPQGVQCPKPGCKSYVRFSLWNVGRSISHGPRILHEMNYIVLLVPAMYLCTDGHELISTDPYILQQFPEQEHIPFFLFHRSGITRQFCRAVISLCIEGLSFSAVEHFITSRRTDYIASLQLQVQCIPQFRTVFLCTHPSLNQLHLPYPSNNLLTKCFIQNFAENRDIYTNEMSSLQTSGFISIDHTFKVTANLYRLPQARWTLEEHKGHR